MRKTTLFAAAVSVSVLIGIDAWLSIRTLTPGVLAGSFFLSFFLYRDATISSELPAIPATWTMRKRNPRHASPMSSHTDSICQ
jgi:hypothetical protein